MANIAGASGSSLNERPATLLSDVCVEGVEFVITLFTACAATSILFYIETKSDPRVAFRLLPIALLT